VWLPRTRPPYPEEFRREAVELVRSSGRSVNEIAKDPDQPANDRCAHTVLPRASPHNQEAWVIHAVQAHRRRARLRTVHRAPAARRPRPALPERNRRLGEHPRSQVTPADQGPHRRAIPARRNAGQRPRLEVGRRQRDRGVRRLSEVAGYEKSSRFWRMFFLQRGRSAGVGLQITGGWCRSRWHGDDRGRGGGGRGPSGVVSGPLVPYAEGFGRGWS
jgi:hypothetical protein